MLVAHLVAAHPQPVPFGVLQEAFWGAEPPSNPEASMRVAVTRLRRTLGEDLIEHTAAGYVLTGDLESIDRARFHQASSAARDAVTRGELAEALDLTRGALAEWGGAAFASVTDNHSLSATIQALDDERTSLEDLLVDLLIAAGHSDRAAMEAGRLTDALPLRERRWEQLMSALYLGGRSAEALRVFQQYRTMLGGELGLEPGASMRGLEAAIAVGDPVTSWLRFETAGGAAELFDLRDELAPVADPPSSPTSFVDRPMVIAALDDAIEANRLVSLVGGPGSGKTRLLMAWAGGLDPEELAWVDLAVETPETVELATLAALGVADLAGGDQSPLMQRLGGRRRFLLFDNAEHVAPSVASVAGRLVDAHPNVSVVITSRMPVGAPGERVVRLGPMTPAESLRLLRERCPTFDALSPGEIDTLLASADGLPLAIEFAARRVSEEEPFEVAVRILDEGSGIAFERLINGDRDLVVSLAPMRGSFDVEAAAHLAQRSPNETRAGLNRLIDASLLHVVPDPVRMRFRFLEPIRQLAEVTADGTGELGSLQSRHLEFYAASTIERGAGLLTADEERAIGLLEEDAPQVRAAWRHACAVNDVDRAAMLASGWWWMTLRSLSHRDYSRPAETMDLPGFEDSPWSRDVLAAASMSEWARGRILRSTEAGEAALAIESSGPIERPPFEARLGLIASYGFRERIQDAHEQMIALIREAQEHESWYHLSGAQGQVAIAFALAGLDAESHGQADAALESAERSENTSTLSFAHHAKAIVLVDEDPHAALSELYESIRLATRVHNRWHLGWTTATLAGLYRRHHRYEEAAIKLDGLIEHWLAAEMEPQFVSAVLESALLFAAVGNDDGVRLALTIANDGRTHHPMLPRDRSAIEDLRAVNQTPPPLRSESELVGELRATLDSLTAGST